MRIRLMRPEDYDALMELWLRTPGMGLNKQDDSPEGLERYLRRNPTTSFVAEENGALLGEIMAGHDGRRGTVHHTAVRGDARGRGIGRALVDAALAALAAEDIRKVNLVAFGRNKGGNAFWEKMGFTSRPDLVYRNRALAQIDRVDT